MNFGKINQKTFGLSGPIVAFVGAAIVLAIVNRWGRGTRALIGLPRGAAANRDPRSGASDPAGSGIGTIVAGAAARSAVGSGAGPVGAVVSGLAGAGVAETIAAIADANRPTR